MLHEPLEDFLESTARVLGKTEWELFCEICECSQVGNARRDMLWTAWVQEDFIPCFVKEALYKITLGTIFEKESFEQDAM